MIRPRPLRPHPRRFSITAMKKRPANRAALAAALAVCTLAAVPAAHAQSGASAPARVTIPKPKGDLKGTPITSILTAVVLSAGIIMITLLPSKRGHQD